MVIHSNASVSEIVMTIFSYLVRSGYAVIKEDGPQKYARLRALSEVILLVKH